MLAVGAAAAAAALLYAFIVVVDPFDTLPLSPPLARAPVATNARFSFPALARSAEFDSAVIGTSTSRLLRPAALDPAFGGARFVNLSMNAATAYEQARILGVFLRAHPHPRAVIIGLDIAWCGIGPQPRYTPRPFPEWMYGRDRWRGYREMFNLYALTQAFAQFLHVTGLKPSRYGLDGYTSFVPDDRLYDPARVAMHLRQDEAAFARADIAGDPGLLAVSRARSAGPQPCRRSGGYAGRAVFRAVQPCPAGAGHRHGARSGPRARRGPRRSCAGGAMSSSRIS